MLSSCISFNYLCPLSSANFWLTDALIVSGQIISQIYLKVGGKFKNRKLVIKPNESDGLSSGELPSEQYTKSQLNRFQESRWKVSIGISDLRALKE